jgi:hypothetical protein
LSAATARSSIALASSGVPNSWAAIEPTLAKDAKIANAKIKNLLLILLILLMASPRAD